MFPFSLGIGERTIIRYEVCADSASSGCTGEQGTKLCESQLHEWSLGNTYCGRASRQMLYGRYSASLTPNFSDRSQRSNSPFYRPVYFLLTPLHIRALAVTIGSAQLLQIECRFPMLNFFTTKAKSLGVDFQSLAMKLNYWVLSAKARRYNHTGRSVVNFPYGNEVVSYRGRLPRKPLR